jgi:DNA-binding SARP family transcriptional activator/antirestriction protein
MEFRLLGYVELWHDGARRDLGSAKERCLLAALLVDLDRVVAVDTLIDRMWGTEPPAQARQGFHANVSRLRRTLRNAVGPDAAQLDRRGGAYLLQVDPAHVDLYQFRDLVARAKDLFTTGDDEAAGELLREADRLWRGVPLGDLDGEWVTRTRAALEEERLAAIQKRVEVDLRQDRYAAVIGELQRLLAEHPYDESLAMQLMRALHGAGRQADALELYQTVRRRLHDDLGAEPGQKLRDLQVRILNQDPELVVAPQRTVAPTVPPPRQPTNQLPPDVAHFVGRADELAALTGDTGDGDVVLIEAIDGMAGVGKTALAVHAAHRLTERYPDAQLCLRLLGHDEERHPLDVANGLASLLRAIGVPAEHLPRTVEEREVLWRAEMASKRAILLLDDAADDDQVTPLLPGSAGCLVLVTSRRRLVGLEGVTRSISLRPLATHEAGTLFSRIVGDGRTRDATAVGEVIRFCGNLPLAIGLMAKRLRHRPTWTVRDLIDLLLHHRKALPEHARLTAVFEVSLRDLSADDRLAFQHIALHPGHEFAADTAAALAGRTISDTRRLLHEFVDRNLVEESAAGRYRYHDLIRMFARDLPDQDAADRSAAMERLLRHALTRADRADRLLYPHSDREPLEGVDTTTWVTTAEEARVWMESELPNLLSLTRAAAEQGFLRYAALLPYILADCLETWGHWDDATRLHQVAVDAWKTLGDDSGRARALSDLAVVHWRCGRFAEALSCSRRAIQLSETQHDTRTTASALVQIGQVEYHQGKYLQAIQHSRQGYQQLQAEGDIHGAAKALNHMAINHFHFGDYARSLKMFAKARELYASLSDHLGEMQTVNNMGDVHFRLDHWQQARDHYLYAQALNEEVGSRQAEGILLQNCATLDREANHFEDAIRQYLGALTIFRQIGDRRCEADALLNLSSTYLRTDRIADALPCAQQSLTLGVHIGEPSMQARAYRKIAQIYDRTQPGRPALQMWQQAFEAARNLADPWELARALVGLGDAICKVRGPQVGAIYLGQALSVYEELGLAGAAESLRQHLEELT